MPLKLATRPGRATIYVRGTVRGQSVYESTGTSRRDDAEAFRAKLEQELWTKSVYGSRAVVTFSTAVESYLRADRRSPGQSRLVNRLHDHFDGRRLGEINQVELDGAYRALLKPDASPATKLRNVLTPLRAILEHAARRGWCDRPAFEVPRQRGPRVAFLLPAQATGLVEAAAPHIRPLVVFLIGTAARMSEALELDWRDLDLAAGRVAFRRTKTGRERHVDLAPTVRAALAALPHREGRVFRPAYRRRRMAAETGPQWAQGDAYHDSGRTGGGQIKTGWAAACRRAGLPGEWRGEEGADRRFVPQLHPHDLRHTAATWHYALHKDLLRLQQFGGWANLSQVQVYGHLLPEAYEAAVAAWLGVAVSRKGRKRA